MNDQELASHLGNILNYIGRIEGRFQGMRDYLRVEDDHPFSGDFMHEQQRDIDDLEAAARKCMSAISGPLELQKDEEDTPIQEQEPEAWEEDEDEDSEWDNVQDV